MESWFRSIFLVVGRALCLLLLASTSILAQESVEPPQVIEPQVQRRDVDVGAIDSEDFELTGFFGLMSMEDFESNAVYGLRLAYHINSALFAEASYGVTTLGTSSGELGAPDFFSDRDVSYYDVSLGWNAFPGEVFFGSGRAWNSALYFIGGMGSTKFAGDDNFTTNLGFGFKVLPSDFIAVRLEVRDYLFDSDVTGRNKVTNNIQTTLNIGWFF
jgi:outer membrane beta-barrel protein